MTRFSRSLMLVVASLGVVAPAVHAQQPEWTVLIRGGTVVAGTGAARYAAEEGLVAARTDEPVTCGDDALT